MLLKNFTIIILLFLIAIVSYKIFDQRKEIANTKSSDNVLNQAEALADDTLTNSLSSHQLIIETGNYSGECLGYCKTALSISSEGIIIKKSGHSKDGLLPDLITKVPISDKQWNSLSNHVDYEKFNSLEDHIPCSDCTLADYKKEWINIIFPDDTEKKIVFAYNNPVLEIKELVEELRDIRKTTLFNLKIIECEQNTNSQEKDDCYYHTALSYKDLNTCDKIRENNKNNKCYYVLGTSTEDVNICSRIADQKLKDDCYYHVAVPKRDLKTCQILSNPEQKDQCIILVKGYSKCDKISTKQEQYSCYLGIQKALTP